MEKIAIALQRSLRAEQANEGMFSGSLDSPTSSPVTLEGSQATIPGEIQFTRTRSVDIAPAVLERHRVAALQNDAVADAFRTLRTELLMKMRQNGWRTLAVTSPNKGAGKSTVSLNLALSFAMEIDHTSLLVDADLRDPDVRKLLEVPPGPGLSDYLVGNVKLEDLLIHPSGTHLVVLPGGAPVPNSAELMRSPMMADLVHELGGRYPERLVVFDVPPVLSGADTLALSSYMDATILLVEERRTTRDQIERSCEMLKHSNLIGVVLNKSRELSKPDPIVWPEPTLLQRVFGRAL